MSNPPIRVAILTVSDRCARGEATDASGPAVAQWVQSRLGGTVTATDCVPDEASLISDRLQRWARDLDAPDLILTTGGTGLSPRDVTPEATFAVLERPHPALLELARLRCLSQTPLTFLSRGAAGALWRTLIINLPGSPQGATQTIDALADVLPHAIDTLREKPDVHRPPGGKILPMLLAALIAWVALFASCLPAPLFAAPISVAAAISLEKPLKQAARDFHDATGHDVQLTFGSSGQLLAQISGGAAIDVFISAGEPQMDRLMDEHLGDPATRRVIATNSLVLIVPATRTDDTPAIARFVDLTDPRMIRLAIGEPETVPAGRYAAQTLRHLKLLDPLKDRLVYGASVRQVLDYVARGEASAGLVYSTEARREADRVRVVDTAPSDSHDPIRYSAAVVHGARDPAAADAFIQFLLSAKGLQILESEGFSAPDAPATQPVTPRE